MQYIVVANDWFIKILAIQMLLLGPFVAIILHLHENFLQSGDSNGHFEMLNVSKS